MTAHKLFIQQNGETFRFLSFEFRDHADGSLLIIFDRDGLAPEKFYRDPATRTMVSVKSELREKFRISYHTSGRVNFHGIGGNPPIMYCDPIYNIVQPQPLASFSLPSIGKLSKGDPNKSNWIIDFPSDLAGRQNLYLTLLPDRYQLPAEMLPLALISYQGWFSLCVHLGPLPDEIPLGMEEHVFKYCLTLRKHDRQQISKEQALISFHQKRAGTSDIVTSWEPNEGIYRIIFNVPMRIPPRPTIEFVESGIEAEYIKVETNEIRFKAKGSGGILKTPKPIKKIILDAEL